MAHIKVVEEEEKEAGEEEAEDEDNENLFRATFDWEIESVAMPISGKC